MLTVFYRSRKRTCQMSLQYKSRDFSELKFLALCLLTKKSEQLD